MNIKYLNTDIRKKIVRLAKKCRNIIVNISVYLAVGEKSLVEMLNIR